MEIKIAIADDHPLVIGGICNLLHRYPHIKLVGSFASGTALLEGLKHITPDVLLLDIQLTDYVADQLISGILKSYPGLKVLTLTNFDSTLYVENMFRYGVHGYLLKTAEERVLIEAIETVYKGAQYVDELMTEKMQRTNSRIQKRQTSKSSLTLREKEILQLLVNGGSCPQIAEQLFLSVNTVVNYRASIMLKLDVNNTALLVKKALMLGLAQ